MIQKESILQVVDNSGVKSIKCIGVFENSKRIYSYVGDIIKASIQEVRSNKQKKFSFSKGEIVLAFILHSKSTTRRKNGQDFRFLKNGAIIIDKNKQPVGTRISSPLFKEFRDRKLLKIISLSSTVL